MYIDYNEVKDRNLRLHIENNISGVIKFEESNILFLNASANDRFLWNFHVCTTYVPRMYHRCTTYIKYIVPFIMQLDVYTLKFLLGSP